MVFSRALAACLCVVAAIVSSGPAAAARVEVGVLRCTVAGGVGMVFGSTKDLDCSFSRPGGNEFYHGTITRYGIDIGATELTTIAWAVLAPTADVPSGALSGSYGGVSAEATVGLGVGANVLIGGLESSIALQPLSVQTQQGGINIAIGIAALNLAQVPPPVVLPAPGPLPPAK